MRQLILIISMMAVISESGYSQNPTYTLKAMYFHRPAPNELTFDIRLTWTNDGIAPNYEYAGGQYFFDFNKAITANGTVTMSNAGSDLPMNMQPRNPTVYTVTTPGQLRWAVNTFPGAGSGFQMPANIPVLVVRVKLHTVGSEFPQVPLGLAWRSALPGPFTKMFAYVGIVNTDISTPATHSIDTVSNFPSNIDVKVAIEGLLNADGSHASQDSIEIIIRNIFPPYDLVYSKKTLLDQLTLTARINRMFEPGTYYLVVKSRNSLETWSKPGGENFSNTEFSYDFTPSSSQAYGSNMLFKNGKYCLYSGNVNGDNIIDAEDLLMMDNEVYNYASGNSVANVNGDAIVDIDDMAICDYNARELRVTAWPGYTGLKSLKNITINP